MSWKIYTAYRCKEADFWSVVVQLRNRAREPILAALKNALEELVPVTVPAVTLFARQRKLRDQYVSQLSSPYRNPADISVTVSFCHHRGYVLAVPHADMLMRGCLDFMKDIPELEDYPYWNNTDRPENVSDAEWDARGKNWRESVDTPKVTLALLHKDSHELFSACFRDE